eukprot:contig_13498_g3236
MNVEAMREEGYPDGEDVVVLSPPYFDGPRLDVAHAAAPRDRRAPTQPDPWVAGPARSSVRRVREIASLLPARDPTGLPPVPVTDVAAAAAVVLPATPSGSLSRLGRQSTVLPPPWTSAESVYSTASESPGPLVRRTTGRQSSSPGGSPVPGGCYLSDFEGSSAGDSRTVRVGSTGGLGHVDSVASSSSDSDGEHGVSLAARYKAAVLDAEELAVDARAAEAEAELEKAKASLRENLYVLAVILFFAVSSLSAIFINKSCLSGYGFNFPFTLLMGQMIFSLLTLSLMDLLGPARLPVLTRSQQLRVLLPTLLFIANVVVGLSALSLVNIPMFSAFRRLTLLFVMAAEYIMLNKRYSRSLIAAVVTMTVGAFVSALDDGTFSGLGYALVFINNVLTAAYLASIKRVMVEIDMSPLVLLYYTALLGLPFIAILLPASGELRNVIEAFSTRPDLWSFGFGVSVLLMAASAFLVNFSTSLCTDITTPLTTSVAGQVKNVLQTVLGFFSWGYVFSPINAVGLVLALMGQCWFAWIKYSQRHLPVGPTAGGFPVVDGDGAVATTGGADVSFPASGGAAGVATLTVCHWPSGVLLYSRSVDVVVDVPYVPGFLAFREVPPVVSLLAAYASDVGLPPLPAAPNGGTALLQAVGRGDCFDGASGVGVPCSPLGPFLDVLLCDGNGVLHPRGAGMACAVGVTTGVPTVGVAKQLHNVDGLGRTAVAAAIAAAPARVAAVPLVGVSGVLHGAAYMGAVADRRQRRGGSGSGNDSAPGGGERPVPPPAPGQTASTVPSAAAAAAAAAAAGTPPPPLTPHPRLTRPVYVSVGHRVSLSTALALVASLTPARVPAPIRTADAHSRAAIRGDRVTVCETAALSAVAGGGGGAEVAAVAARTARRKRS